MADMTKENISKRKFSFIRGATNDVMEYEWPDDADKVRQDLSESLNARNVTFLLGAGCSSFQIDNKEVGIPTMAPLAKEFITAREADDPAFATSAERDLLLDQFGIDITAEDYLHNLERLMEVLFSLRFVLERSSLDEASEQLSVINSMIAKVQTFLWSKCTNGAFANGDNTVITVYESFYRKLVLRDRSLPSPWIFTTNYDLFNETAMDRLGLPYANGFSGVVERRFNPAMFRYALAEQLDLMSRKWSAVDGFVYLGKLHGSISWTEDDHGLLPIREIAVLQAARLPRREPRKGDGLSDTRKAELRSSIALCRSVPGVSVAYRARAECAVHYRLCLRRRAYQQYHISSINHPDVQARHLRRPNDAG